MLWYVYILRCGDGTLYTGITDDIPRRLAAHRAGKGAKYTRGRGSLELVYQEQAPDKSAALRREAAIKRLPLKQKTVIVLYYYNEMSVQEIAQATGSLCGTVKSRLFTARRNLAVFLQEREADKNEKEQNVG